MYPELTMSKLSNYRKLKKLVKVQNYQVLLLEGNESFQGKNH